MSDAYSTVDIPKSLPIHGMALTSTGRKIEHSMVVLGTQSSNDKNCLAREPPTSGHKHVMDQGPYNGADSVHWSFIYIYIKELPIYKKESGCIPPRFGDTLSKSRFDFENLTQSEARELPTSGHNSVMEGPRILLIVFIGLYYTYK